MISATSAAELNYLWPINWLGLHQQYLNRGEMEIIAALLRQVEAKSVLEIGCRDGRTARVLLHNVSALQRYVGVDVPMSYEPPLAHQRSEMVSEPGALAMVDPRFELIVRARGSLDVEPTDFEEQFDACFIDGDHSESTVYSDSWLAAMVLRPGGIIIWHDYFNGAVGVTNALNRLNNEDWQIKNIADTWLAYLIR